MGRRAKVDDKETELDLTPCIDVVFLLIVFFILAGRITTEMRANKITVPPTLTAQEMKPPTAQWGHLIIEAFGTTQGEPGKEPFNQIKFGNDTWTAQGLNDFTAYQKLRTALDEWYGRATKFPDPKGTGIMLPEIQLEIRADADTEYRIVQEIMQIASDTIDPFKNMTPKQQPITSAKPFVNLLFTTFKPGDKEVGK